MGASGDVDCARVILVVENALRRKEKPAPGLHPERNVRATLVGRIIIADGLGWVGCTLIDTHHCSYMSLQVAIVRKDSSNGDQLADSGTGRVLLERLPTKFRVWNVSLAARRSRLEWNAVDHFLTHYLTRLAY